MFNSKKTKNKVATRLPIDKSKTDRSGTYYYDEVFNCVDCGNEDIWTAENQKYWYEVKNSYESSVAIRCHICRAWINALKEDYKRSLNVK